MAVFSPCYCFQLHCHASLILKPITGDRKVFLSTEFRIGHLLQKSSIQMDIF